MKAREVISFIPIDRTDQVFENYLNEALTRIKYTLTKTALGSLTLNYQMALKTCYDKAGQICINKYPFTGEKRFLRDLIGSLNAIENLDSPHTAHPTPDKINQMLTLLITERQKLEKGFKRFYFHTRSALDKIISSLKKMQAAAVISDDNMKAAFFNEEDDTLNEIDNAKSIYAHAKLNPTSIRNALEILEKDVVELDQENFRKSLRLPKRSKNSPIDITNIISYSDESSYDSYFYDNSDDSSAEYFNYKQH